MKSQQWISSFGPGPMGRSKSIVGLLNVDLRTLIITYNTTQFITLNLSSSRRRPLSSLAPPPPPPRAAAAAADLRRKFVSGRFDEENPFVQNSSVLLVQPDEGVSVLVVDRIGDDLPQSTEKSRVLVIPVGARHKCQQDRKSKIEKQTPAAAVCGGAPTRPREARDLRAGRAREGTAARTCAPYAQPDLAHLLRELVGRCMWPCGWTSGDDGRNGRALMALLLRAAANVARRCLLRNCAAPPETLAMAGPSRLRCWSTHAAHWLRAMRAGRATLRAASCAAVRKFFVGESPVMS
ncbi:hypothetical protein F511_43265 [Dorcoceras hygrometricum]|uniref:Uncharacterized protein n=1 Tax=Dorcoceras hygrometricum TaxID=472368 RepID=A0A2Z7A1U2_9LAMI|nr:hypothetical protein F511_43265 [Dorcoceras hygrometricum]